MRRSRGRDRGSGPPPPLNNHKNIGFLSNTGPDPLKNHKATKPAFNVGQTSARQCNASVSPGADDDPLLVVGSAVAQWQSAWLETEGPRVRASSSSLRCGPWARHIYPSLVLVQPRMTRPCLTEILLIGRKESNQANKKNLWHLDSPSHHKPPQNIPNCVEYARLLGQTS